MLGWVGWGRGLVGEQQGGTPTFFSKKEETFKRCFSFLFYFSVCMHVWVGVCSSTRMCACAHARAQYVNALGNQKRACVLWTWSCEAVMSHLKWMLGKELPASAGL